MNSTLTRRPPATQPAALPSAPPETLTSLALLCLLLGLGWSRRPLPSTSPRKFTDE